MLQQPVRGDRRAAGTGRTTEVSGERLCARREVVSSDLVEVVVDTIVQITRGLIAEPNDPEPATVGCRLEPPNGGPDVFDGPRDLSGVSGEHEDVLLLRGRIVGERCSLGVAAAVTGCVDLPAIGRDGQGREVGGQGARGARTPLDRARPGGESEDPRRRGERDVERRAVGGHHDVRRLVAHGESIHDRVGTEVDEGHAVLTPQRDRRDGAAGGPGDRHGPAADWHAGEDPAIRGRYDRDRWGDDLGDPHLLAHAGDGPGRVVVVVLEGQRRRIDDHHGVPAGVTGGRFAAEHILARRLRRETDLTIRSRVHGGVAPARSALERKGSGGLAPRLDLRARENQGPAIWEPPRRLRRDTAIATSRRAFGRRVSHDRVGRVDRRIPVGPTRVVGLAAAARGQHKDARHPSTNIIHCQNSQGCQG